MRLALGVILDVTSDPVTDEAFVVLHMFCSLNRREVNGIDVHGTRVSYCSGKEGFDAASFLQSSDLFLLSMEFAHLFNPLVQCGGDVFD